MGGIPSRLNLRDALALSGTRSKQDALAEEEFDDHIHAALAGFAAGDRALAVGRIRPCAAMSSIRRRSLSRLADQIKWSEPSPAGARNAVLVGDPTKEGLYVQMVKWLGGDHFSRPHFHPNDRFITVLGGTWWVGTGTKFDPEATLPMRPGAFVTHFGKQVHFDGAKEEDAMLLIVGQGPATSTPAEVK